MIDSNATPSREPLVQTDTIKARLINELAAFRGVPPSQVDAGAVFSSMGLGSLDSAALAGRLQDWLGRPVATTLFWDHPTIDLLSRVLAGEAPHPVSSVAVLGSSTTARPCMDVIGMACRFPGADSPDALWRLLLSGGHAIVPVSPRRWPKRPDTEQAGLLDDVGGFDAAFFGISSVEAEEMDPQQRLLLEVVWEAIESAGIRPQSLRASRTGVFVGISSFDYMRTRVPDSMGATVYSASGAAHSIAANRLSYVLHLNGPCLAVDTACSSSLTALHLASQSLAAGECDLAIVAGVNLILDPDLHAAFRRAGMLASDGRCKTFDAQADGYVRGEGCGAVLLRRSSDEAGPEDDIRPLAVLRATAVNQDGRSNGLFAPRREAQVAVIREALARAGLKPSDVAYIETHGTGTRLGDAIELEAIAEALLHERDSLPLQLGALKRHIGHLEAAAGIAGLIKTILVLQKRVVPPLPLPGGPNAAALAFGAALAFPDAACDLLPSSPDGLIASVSSFGFGGTNAHAIVAAAPAPLRRASTNRERGRLLLLSGHRPQALAQQADSVLRMLREGGRSADICTALNAGREPQLYRKALRADDDEALTKVLAEVAQGACDAIVPSRPPGQGMVWQFPGQGAQQIGMARDWYRFSPLFRLKLEHVCAIARPHIGFDILALLVDGDRRVMQETSVAQPALFCVAWAMAECLRSWLPEPPRALLGHSLGAYVAACQAGCMSLEQAVWLVAERGRCFELSAGLGQMIVARCPAHRLDEVLGALRDKVDVSAINAPEQCVLACAVEDAAACLEALGAHGIQGQVFNERYAFHSRFVAPAIEAFERSLAKVDFTASRTDLICDLTGAWLPVGTVLGAAHWIAHGRRTIRFDLVHATAAGAGMLALIEVGPGSVLSTLARYNSLPAQLVRSVMPAAMQPWHGLLSLFADLFESGVDIAWQAFARDMGWSRAALPAPPFIRETFWKPGIHEEDGVPLVAQPGALTFSSSEASMTSQQTGDVQDIAGIIAQELAKTLRVDPRQIDIDANLLDMGIDSLVLIGAVDFIQSRFGIKLPMSAFFAELNTVRRIAVHLAASAVGPVSSEFAASLDAPTGRPIDSHERPIIGPTVDAAHAQHASMQPPGDWQALFRAQLETVAGVVHRQLAALGASVAEVAMPGLPTQQLATQGLLAQALPTGAVKAPLMRDASQSVRSAVAPSNAPSFMPFKAGQERSVAARLPRQAAFLETFCAAYTRRTGGSKRYAAVQRTTLADNRMVSGFRLGTKQMVYPIVSDMAQGAHVQDIDGNRYLDLTMGFGVGLFGHNPPFVMEAVMQGLKRGFSLGPQSSLAGEVAALLCRITRHERATFANTGSEAVMLALRLARAHTRRPRVVIFTGSYHGTADTVMARAGHDGALPFAPGITESQVEDVVILDYGADAALDYIGRHADEIAAVLVEPVQSRQPEVQPKAFLHALRRLTKERGIALVFDEVLNGFRIHLRGGQGYYGIEADLAAYGKIMGGGLPIGAVAGQAAYLDHIDGGAWSYDDDSYPETAMTFFAGTFCKHPLALHAAKAVLTRLAQDGQAVVDRAGAKTKAFVDAVNAGCQGLAVPLRIERCASLFRIPAIKDVELLHYALIHNGLYIWEGRNCFISEVHDDQELAEAARTFVRTVKELAQLGFLGVDPQPPHDGGDGRAAPAEKTPRTLSGVFDGAVEPSREQAQLLALYDLGDPRWKAYRINFAIGFSSSVDEERLRQAIAAVQRRHEALRMRVVVRGGRHWLEASEDAHVDWDTARVEAAGLQQALMQRGEAPYDPYAQTVLKAHLLHVDDGSRVLMLAMHHLLVDGWSAGIILEDLLKAYDEPQASQVKARALSQFLQERRLARKAPAYEALARWWHDRMLSQPDAHVPAFETTHGDGHWRALQQVEVLPADQREALSRQARTQGMTLFQFLLAAYGLAMHRVSGRGFIKLAVPVGGRQTDADAEVVGYCSNLCLVPSRHTAGMVPGAYVEALRKGLLESMDAGEYGYADLVDAAQGLGNPNAAQPDALFNLERTPHLPDSALGALKWLPVPSRTAAFAQFVNVVDHGGQLTVVVDHIAEVPARRVLDAFKSVLDEWCGTVPADMTRAAVFAGGAMDGWLRDMVAHARSQPDMPAIKEGGFSELSYGALLARARGMARMLQEHGVRQGQVIGVCSSGGGEGIAAVLGVLLLGACYVPLDPSYPPERNAYCLADSRASLLLVDGAAGEIARLRPSGCEVLDLSACDVARYTPNSDDGFQVPSIDGQAPAYVIYTSGSTGQPKGVMISRSSLDGFMQSMKQRWSVRPHDRFVRLTPVAFDIAALEMFLPLACGASCVVASPAQRADGHALVSLLREESVTVVQATPATWALLRQAKGALPSLRIGGIGGESPPRNLLDFIRSTGAQAWNLYGPTEATIWAALWLADGSDRVLLGEPLVGVFWRVLDEEGQAVADGQAGELYLGGACLAHGYWRRPGLTAQKFVPDPLGKGGGRLFRTGDLVRTLPGGQLQFINRVDAQIKLRGHRIELGEIEAQAQALGSVGRAVCCLARDAQGEPVLQLFAVAAPGVELDERVLRKHLVARLPAYMLPARITLASSLPLTPNGKVDRKALSQAEAPQQAEAAAVASAGVPMPHRLPDGAQDAILAICREVLERDDIGLDDDVFEFGLYSLRAARMLMMARERLGVALSYELVMSNPTPRRLWSALVAREPVEDGAVPAGPAHIQAATPGAVAHADESLALPGTAPLHAAVRPPGPFRATSPWFHTRFVLGMLGLHVPAVPFVWSYQLARRIAPRGLMLKLRFLYPRIMARSVLYAAGAKVTVHGLEKLPRDGRAMIVLSNHQSRFDAYLLAAHLPFAFKSFGSDEDHVRVEKLSLISWIDRAFDLSFMHYKKDPLATDQEFSRARDFLVKQNGRLALFPEGQFGGDRIGRIGDACCQLARDADAWVVPVALVRSANLYEANGYRYAPASVEIHIGDAMEPLALGSTPQQMAQSLGGVLQRLVDQAGSDTAQEQAETATATV